MSSEKRKIYIIGSPTAAGHMVARLISILATNAADTNAFITIGTDSSVPKSTDSSVGITYDIENMICGAGGDYDGDVGHWMLKDPNYKREVPKPIFRQRKPLPKSQVRTKPVINKKIIRRK